MSLYLQIFEPTFVRIWACAIVLLGRPVSSGRNAALFIVDPRDPCAKFYTLYYSGNMVEERLEPRTRVPLDHSKRYLRIGLGTL
ncbi:hypothetical protein EI94DRAFT_1745242, partial [Lactarius quietus]